jgi:hypothetical protein
MKNPSIFAIKLVPCVIFLLLAALMPASVARAGLTVDIHLYHDTYGYYFYPWLNTNTNLPNFPTGNYLIASPQIPTGGSQLQYQATNNSLNYLSGGGNYYGDFNSFLYGITNGQWTISVTNSTSTNQYHFTVRVTGLTSNAYGAPVMAGFPTDGALYVTNQPLFSWTGPTNWAGTLLVVDDYIDDNGTYNYVTSANLPANQTTWQCPVVLPDGTNNFSVYYSSNVTAFVFASTPTNHAGQPISGWVSTATMDTEFPNGPQFTVGSPIISTSNGGHTNIAHYTFDNSANTFQLGLDSSPNANNLVTYSYWGPVHTNTADAVSGGAVQFFGTSSMICYDQVLSNLNAVLAGSFTFSTWVKTTASRGNDSDDAVYGATIFWAYNDHNGTNDAIPLAITGSKAAFSTRDYLGNTVTIHSITSVNDGNYHLLAVTRNQSSGEMKIFVDGNYEASTFGTTEPLNANNYYLSIGGTTISSYTGKLDDLQIYSGVLSPAEVAALYSNPGTTIPDVAGSAAAGLTVHYDFDEGTVLAPDVSGNGNNIIVAGNIDDFNGDNPTISTNSIAGAGSVSFDGYSFLTTPTNLLSTIAGTFSLSLWVKTTDDSGYQGDDAWDGACIVSADIPNSLVNGDIVPVALTGGQVAFNTGSPGNDDTMNSQALVNDGQWHHIVVMRNQPTGEKDIYVDGVLDTSDFDTTNLLTDPQILTIGCKADASNSDPEGPSYTGSNGYTGLVDDLQLYNRILSPNEVSYLYNNPGATAGSFSFTPYPVDISLHVFIQRSQDPNEGEYYSAGVSFDSVSPSPTTTNSVSSPNGYYSTETDPYSGSGSSVLSSSLGDVLNEITNGSWKIYINQSSPTQEVYSFQVSVKGLDTNLLAATKILYPTNGSTSVLPNASFFWHGPTNFSILDVGLFTGPDTDVSLPITATNWTPSQAMTNGSQTFFVSYNFNNFTNITFTTPVDASLNPIHSWNATGMLNSEAFSAFVVSGPASVRLVSAKNTGGNFQFSFNSQTGYTNTVQYRTNLTLGTWQTYSKITGDGTLKNVSVPNSVFNGAKQGFIRIITQ